MQKPTAIGHIRKAARRRSGRAGTKTSHAVSCMGNSQGVVHAVDIDTAQT
jgi:hypothetical protein